MYIYASAVREHNYHHYMYLFNNFLILYFITLTPQGVEERTESLDVLILLAVKHPSLMNL